MGRATEDPKGSDYIIKYTPLCYFTHRHPNNCNSSFSLCTHVKYNKNICMYQVRHFKNKISFYLYVNEIE